MVVIKENLYKVGDLTLRLLGEDMLKVYVGEKIQPENLLKLVNLNKSLQELKLPGIKDTVIAYLDLTIFFDPILLSSSQLIEHLAQLKPCSRNLESRVIEIPVQYGGKYGPDLEHVAETNHLNPEEVIQIHASGMYLVYAIGFTPGFPYLGGLSEKLYTPRKTKPRLMVPPGSVGIGGWQTGIYPMASPGGWQIIGKTELDFFDKVKDEPCLLRIGDTVKFVAI